MLQPGFPRSMPTIAKNATRISRQGGMSVAFSAPVGILSAKRCLLCDRLPGSLRAASHSPENMASFAESLVAESWRLEMSTMTTESAFRMVPLREDAAPLRWAQRATVGLAAG